jgi:hypothetical protein
MNAPRRRPAPAARHAAAVGVAALLAAGATRAETWLYRVSFDPAEPLTARVVVELPAVRRAQDFSVQVRGLAAGLAPQTTDLRCDGVPLAPDSASAWRVQGWACARLAWKVTVRAAGPDGTDPRARETVFDPQASYWLFSDATSLLRPVDEPGHDGLIEFAGGTPVHGGALAAAGARRIVPPADAPAEFFVVGRLAGASLREGGFDLLHLDALGIRWPALLAEQARALRYLDRAAGAQQLAPLRMSVLWFAGPTDDGAPIGVAGNRTLLLAAAKRDGALQRPEAALAWMLRELLLRAMPARMPPWARHGLAQYYAIKALRRTELPPAAIAAVERQRVDAARLPPVRLREAQRRALAGDAGMIGEMQLAGAAFWERVDRAIVRKSGFRTLDSVLPRLLAAEWPDDRLPAAVLERMRFYAGDSAIDELLAQYVGD